MRYNNTETIVAASVDDIRAFAEAATPLFGYLQSYESGGGSTGTFGVAFNLGNHRIDLEVRFSSPQHYAARKAEVTKLLSKYLSEEMLARFSSTVLAYEREDKHSVRSAEDEEGEYVVERSASKTKAEEFISEEGEYRIVVKRYNVRNYVIDIDQPKAIAAAKEEITAFCKERGVPVINCAAS